MNVKKFVGSVKSIFQKWAPTVLTRVWGVSWLKIFRKLVKLLFRLQSKKAHTKKKVRCAVRHCLEEGLTFLVLKGGSQCGRIGENFAISNFILGLLIVTRGVTFEIVLIFLCAFHQQRSFTAVQALYRHEVVRGSDEVLLRGGIFRVIQSSSYAVQQARYVLVLQILSRRKNKTS